MEFAGGGRDTETPSAGITLHDVGRRTLLDHIQVHASASNGLVFRGGTAHCSHCVVSDARHDSVAWSAGWRGTVQYLFVQQGERAAAALKGSSAGSDGAPTFYNLTLVGGYNIRQPGGSPGKMRSIGPGILLEDGSAIVARNVLAVGFAGFAIDGSATSFNSGRSSVTSAILTSNAYRYGARMQVHPGIAPYVDFTNGDPKFLNVRHEPNPDPRPRNGSATLRLGNAVAPPFDDTFSGWPIYVGAFEKQNWLEQWTFFGSERYYHVPVEVD